MRDRTKKYNRYGDEISFDEWVVEFEKSDRRVAEDNVNGYWISTVWLGIDHSWSQEGPPLLFETMVFPSEDNFSELYCDRYPTEEEALIGHEHIVEAIKEG